MKLARTSLVLLVVQLALVSSIAAKYLYQRWNCPRVWVRTVAYDPDMVMRGRYLSLRLEVNGCGRIALPPLKEVGSVGPRNSMQRQWQYDARTARFPVTLKVENQKLVAIPLPVQEARADELSVLAPPGVACDLLRVQQPVDFYIPEHAADPTAHLAGKELWVEVTVPPKGPPRPLQLALKENGVWKPLAFE
jgi:uncharacterized membrane-anchored protein